MRCAGRHNRHRTHEYVAYTCDEDMAMLGVVVDSSQIVGVGGLSVFHHSSGKECIYAQISHGLELGLLNRANLHDPSVP
jgi:hypothetical protein